MMDPIPGYQLGTSEESIFLLNFQHNDSQFRAVNDPVIDGSSERPYLIADINDDISIEDASSSNPSSDLHICSVLDFYLSENVPLHFNSLMGFSNDANSYQSYQYQQWDMNMLFNMDDRNSLFPFQNVNSFSGNEEGADDTSLYLQSGIGSGNGIGGCLGDLELIPGDLPDLLEVDSGGKSDGAKRVTLVLDLDETLVHSTLTHCEDADFTFEVYADMKTHKVYVKKRPHLHHFLEKVAQMFEIVIFTASQSAYASKLLDRLDPDGRLFSKRLYRESCIFFGEGNYTKDLTILGMNLAKVAIIDNLPQVYRLQEDNGIPITSWFDDLSDDALIQLLPFLETLADAEDVRPLISKKFGTNRQSNI